ncbi:MAG: toll/interleukin-1 receptor domain-containing protein [Methylobacter sp.]|nr:toll/interleukin-1 receptor domain-containing protein [Methylobacter sp.]
MPNPKHLNILLQGVETWNSWRREYPTEKPDLWNANITCANLNGVNFSRANLSGADFNGSKLNSADLTVANISAANFNDTELNHADLRGAQLDYTRLRNADLTEAIIYAVLNHTDLTGATLTRADLRTAHLYGAKLSEADLGRILIQSTIFSDLDLRKVIGLETVRHNGPSSIGLDTIYKSRGEIPDMFLRNTGVPEEFIQNMLPLIRTGPSVQMCFISYSSMDEAFARRLHERMRSAGLRVWFAPEDMKGGRKLHEQIFEAIQSYDKLLVVLSPHSLKSEWVMTEIRKARESEKIEHRRKLFPIRLVNFNALRAWTCFDSDTGQDLAVAVREYFIPDFSNWHDDKAFESAFASLLRDLSSTD